MKIKKPCKFIKFNIAKFYPSISVELFEKSINFARSIIKIEDKIINIIKHSRKYLLFHNSNAWVKKEGNLSFDITMGRWRGLWACRALFVKQTHASNWYKKHWALKGWWLTENGQDNERYCCTIQTYGTFYYHWYKLDRKRPLRCLIQPRGRLMFSL